MSRESTVELAAGTVRGSGRAFLGIPYGRPPVGERRWRAPAPADPWPGIRDATTHGAPAPQPHRAMSDFALGPLPPGAEDCLTLNVWVPPGVGPWPVLVWAIGGGWTIGWTGADLYDGARLANAAQVVVVTFNYRLGSLGWVCHPSLAAEHGHPAGNWGLLDTALVLDWLQENVAAFGGDPARVTLGGQSAGAANVAALLVSPLAAGTFAQAILHSPPLPEAGNDPARSAQWAEDLATLLVGRPEPQALRGVPAERIVAAHEELLGHEAWRGTRGGAWPTLDASTIPIDPLSSPGARHEVPVLVGSMRDEATFLFRAARRVAPDEGRLRAMVGGLNGVDDADATIARHRARAEQRGQATDPEALLIGIFSTELFTAPLRRWAGGRAGAGASVHLFGIEHEAPDPALGALHTIDVPLLLGTFRGSEVARHLADDDERTSEVSEAMTRAWAAFLHGRSPGWPALRGAPHDVLAILGGAAAAPLSKRRLADSW